ncbi:MAG: hypothetical protein Q8P73_05450 [bacterium]|nr:hypothetical protein [bacterium]
MREYSERLMQEIFTDAHRVADALNLDTIGQKKRARLHALMCRLHDQLPGLGEDERAEVLARECRNY